MTAGKARRRLPFAPGPGFFVWVALMALTVILTQGLRSTVSHMIFWFVVLLPVWALAYVLIGWKTVDVSVQVGDTRIEKMEPLPYEITLTGGSPLCFPVLEVMMSLPRADGVRSAFQCLVYCLLPFGTYDIRETAVFRYRGTYQVGVDCLYLTDLLRFFRIRRRVDLMHTVLVYPRRMVLGEGRESASSDVPSERTRRILGGDPSDVGNIREYRPGDPIKSVHWKLSSKAEDLQVKEYETDRNRRVYILCDYSRTLPADGTSEKTEEKKEPKANRGRKVRLRTPEELKKNPLRRAADRAAAKRRARVMALAAASAVPETAEACRLLPEYADEIDELNADGVSEIAAAAVVRELREGNDCTLIWYDERNGDHPVSRAEIRSGVELDAVWTSFATTPPCGAAHNLRELALAVDDTMNVTVRMVTGKLDADTVGAAETTPSLLGGAGVGCVAEVLLYDPETRYAPTERRRAEVSAVAERLSESGVRLRRFTEASLAGPEEIRERLFD